MVGGELAIYIHIYVCICVYIDECGDWTWYVRIEIHYVLNIRCCGGVTMDLGLS